MSMTQIYQGMYGVWFEQSSGQNPLYICNWEVGWWA